MCGICGFTERGDLGDLERMAHAMEHRGPDAEGFWHNPERSVYLGHRRLSIIDITGGQQPMSTSDGVLTVVFNGEIYNKEELRRDLKHAGHLFRSESSDTEVLLHGYREWGGELPSRLNGMWAFAIYDAERREIFISRDRFGKKPLFYSFQNGAFVFASELKSLAKHPALTLTVSKRSLKKYFAYGYIPAPLTVYENVFKLPGGHNLLLSLASSHLRVWKYWDFVFEPFERQPRNPEAEWGEEIRFLLKRAIQRRLMSEVPLGFFLSGGIDSSSLVALAAGELGIGGLKTFSIGFEEASYDETDYARTISRMYQTDHHEAILSVGKLKELLPDVLGRLDEPMGDASLIPTFLLCREARKEVTVALGGDGADELFAGYDPFRALRMAELYSRLIPKPMHRAITLAISMLPTSHAYMSLDFRLKRTLRGLSYPMHLWNPIWIGPLAPGDLDDLFQESTDIEDTYSEALDLWDTCSQTNLVDRTMQFYSKLFFQEYVLVKVDRASMMNSLEVRAPYLDTELVDFVRKIPMEFKLRNGRTKYILKEAMRSILPDKVLFRPKQGFGMPIGKWLQEDIFDLGSCRWKGFLCHPFISEKIDEHRCNKADQRAFLWSLSVFHVWNKAMLQSA